ncbi:MAG: hypothetical protein ACLFQL_08995 [Paracoccaceae bacterium]
MTPEDKARLDAEIRDIEARLPEADPETRAELTAHLERALERLRALGARDDPRNEEERIDEEIESQFDNLPL